MKYPTTFLILTMILSACYGGGRTEPYTEDSNAVQVERRKDWQQSDRRIQPGSFAPVILLPPLFLTEKRTTASLSNTRRIVFFWAAWCSDCQEEMPAVIAFQRSHPEIEWIMVSLDNEADKAKAYIKDKNLQGLHLFDGRDWRGDACTDYAVPLHGIPYFILVDTDSRIMATGGKISELEQSLY